MTKHIMIVMSIMLPLNVFAQNTQTFINFDNFETQIQETYPEPTNQLTTEDGQPIIKIGSELFMLDNWQATLQNSSGENMISKKNSYTKKVSSSERGTVLGIRVKFPEWPYDGEAHIHPTFPILPFKQTGEYANINNGVVTNVGDVKSFTMWVNGRNFPFTMGVQVRDVDNKLIEFPLGSLLYLGWRKLVYNNTLFSERIVDNIQGNARVYPRSIPFLRFENIVIYRPGNYAGGDFVGYFGSSDITYTQFFVEMPTDINDESIWGLVSAEQIRKAKAMNSQIYEEILQYEYAKKRMAPPQQNNNAQNIDSQ